MIYYVASERGIGLREARKTNQTGKGDKTMHNAKAGGEIGANGEFYKGGQFVADTEDWEKGSSLWEGAKGEGVGVFSITGNTYIFKEEHWDDAECRYVTDAVFFDDKMFDYTRERGLDDECAKMFFRYLVALYKENPSARISRQDLIDLQYALGLLNYTWGIPYEAKRKGKKVADLTSLTEAEIPAYIERINSRISEAGLEDRSVYEARKEYARLAAIVSHHIGTVGEKMEREVEVTATIPFTNDFGGGTIYKFKDGDGNDLVWMTSSALKTGKDEYGQDLYAGVGDKLRIKFTVKGHDTYKDVPQTKITRVKAVA